MVAAELFRSTLLVCNTEYLLKFLIQSTNSVNFVKSVNTPTYPISGVGVLTIVPVVAPLKFMTRSYHVPLKIKKTLSLFVLMLVLMGTIVMLILTGARKGEPTNQLDDPWYIPPEVDPCASEFNAVIVASYIYSLMLLLGYSLGKFYL